MSKVPYFTDLNYNGVMEAIYKTNEHNPYSNTFDLNLDENAKNWFTRIIYDSENYPTELRNNLLSFYVLKLNILAEEYIVKSIDECQILTNYNDLILDKMVDLAFDILPDDKQNHLKILITCKKVELFCMSKQSIWNSIEYYDKFRYQFTSNRNANHYRTALEKGLLNSKVSKKLKKQIRAIYTFIDDCNQDRTDSFKEKKMIKKKYLKDLPECIQKITSSYCHGYVKGIHLERMKQNKSSKKLFKNESIKELLSVEEIEKIKSISKKKIRGSYHDKSFY